MDRLDGKSPCLEYIVIGATEFHKPSSSYFVSARSIGCHATNLGRDLSKHQVCCIIFGMTEDSQGIQEHRRSTRVPLEVSIEVEGEPDTPPLKGITAVVNLHGALIRTREPLTAGARIRVTVYLTGKSAPARVVWVAQDDSFKCGIELLEPQNIWGMSLPPSDWESDYR